ncbi:heme NO-binding domain-containing protein [bacterium]|nr:heme NO-binding domain-containing protein [bacterium]
MYGMVNNAIETWLTEKYGAVRWQLIKEHSKIEIGKFENMAQYPDGDSVALLLSASSILNKDLTMILEEVGEYWIEYALRSEYAVILKSVAAGKTFTQVLESLDRLHVRVGKSFVNLQPPSFWCSEQTANTVILHYSSKRDGLSHFVIGLVKGLGKMMKIKSQAKQIAFKGKDGNDHDQFLVEFN